MTIGDSDDNRNADEPLPEGWTVKVKVRPSGKKDRCYFPPSGESIFHSKLEVVRYLNNNTPKSEKKKGINLNSSQDVACESPEAQGLPPGWTKEIKVTKKGRKIRKDWFYTDPVSGYVFRSMKDALRYVETGEIGRLASKPQDKSSNNLELEDDEASSPAVAKKQKLEVQENKSSMQRVQRNNPDKSIIAAAGGALSNERSLDNETKKDEIRTSAEKSKKKKDLSLPRRTSKRLSGLPLDPTPELKITDRAHRAALRNSNDKASIDPSKSMKLPLEPNKSKHPVVNLASAESVETENTGNKKPECASISPPGSPVKTENAAEKIQTNNVNDKKPGVYLDLPLGDLCQDPCIAFAIKTLTGISFDNPDTVQVSTGSNSDFGGLATSEDNNRKEDPQFGIPTQQGSIADQPLNNNVVTGEQVEELEISNRDNEKEGSSAFNFSFADAWADPCIEFAIKTLTGAIPLDCDVVTQDYSQHKASSSQSLESSGMSLQNGSEIGQSQIFCKQFGMPGRALMEPGLGHNKNMNVGYLNGTNRAGHGEHGSKGSQR